MYNKYKTTMGELKEDDLVLGLDGYYHPIKLLEIHKPDLMFELTFSDSKTLEEIGKIKSSGNHSWRLYNNEDDNFTILNTDIIYELVNLHKVSGSIFNYSVGKKFGPYITSCLVIPPVLSRCITVLKDCYDCNGNLIEGEEYFEHEFEIETDKGVTLFTQNCQERLVCGQLGSIASRMALDDSSATAIDGTHKGAGLIKAQSEKTNIQYYFEDPKWIEEYYRKRGLNAKGFEENKDTSFSDDIDYDSLVSGDSEIDIQLNKDVTQIDFNNIHKEIDNTKKQKFKEV